MDGVCVYTIVCPFANNERGAKIHLSQVIGFSLGS